MHSSNSEKKHFLLLKIKAKKYKQYSPELSNFCINTSSVHPIIKKE